MGTSNMYALHTENPDCLNGDLLTLVKAVTDNQIERLNELNTKTPEPAQVDILNEVETTLRSSRDSKTGDLLIELCGHKYPIDSISSDMQDAVFKEQYDDLDLLLNTSQMNITGTEIPSASIATGDDQIKIYAALEPVQNFTPQPMDLPLTFARNWDAAARHEDVLLGQGANASSYLDFLVNNNPPEYACVIGTNDIDFSTAVTHRITSSQEDVFFKAQDQTNVSNQYARPDYRSSMPVLPQITISTSPLPSFEDIAHSLPGNSTPDPRRLSPLSIASPSSSSSTYGFDSDTTNDFSDNEVLDDSSDSDYMIGEQKPKAKSSKHRRGCRLWEFIRNLLLDPKTNPSLIRWENRKEGTFKLIQAKSIANIWGMKKGNKDMTYEKFSRAMRYYYKRKIFESVLGQRLVYKFGPKAHGWRE